MVPSAFAEYEGGRRVRRCDRASEATWPTMPRGDSWRTAGRSGTQVVEEYPGVPLEYPQSTPRGPPSPAAGKSIEDFSQFIEEAEVRCA